MKHLTDDHFQDTYDCCSNKQLTWSKVPKISKDWFSYISECVSCGATDHVSVSVGRVKTSLLAREFAAALQSLGCTTKGDE